MTCRAAEALVKSLAEKAAGRQSLAAFLATTKENELEGENPLKPGLAVS
jgi:hypothetical protein